MYVGTKALSIPGLLSEARPVATLDCRLAVEPALIQ